jgi:hypothetical protein
MTKEIAPLTQRQAWKAPEAHYTSIREFHLRKLFADDPKRGERMMAEALGLYLDYSKNRITDETLKLLLQLAEESGLRERIDAIATVRRIRSSPKGSRRKRSLSSSLSTSTRSSPKVLSGTLIPSTSGVWSWVKCWPNALSRN